MKRREKKMCICCALFLLLLLLLVDMMHIPRFDIGAGNLLRAMHKHIAPGQLNETHRSKFK